MNEQPHLIRSCIHNADKSILRSAHGFRQFRTLANRSLNPRCSLKNSTGCFPIHAAIAGSIENFFGQAHKNRDLEKSSSLSIKRF